MDKVVKREIVLRKIPNRDNDIAPGGNYMDRKRCYSIYYYTEVECEDCHKLRECDNQYQKESEKLAKRNRRVGKYWVERPNPTAEPTRAVEKQAETNSRDSFWHSVDVMDLTPTQRKHYKEIMRKEVRK